MKNLEKVALPSDNFVLIALRTESSGNRVSLTLLDDIPLDFGHGSAIGISVSGSLDMAVHCRSGSRCQLSDCTDDGLAECIQWRPLQASVERLTDLTASPSKADVILIVCHRVLGDVRYKFVFAE